MSHVRDVDGYRGAVAGVDIEAIRAGAVSRQSQCRIDGFRRGQRGGQDLLFPAMESLKRVVSRVGSGADTRI